MKPASGVSVLILLGVALGPFAVGYTIARWMSGIWALSPLLWGLVFLVGWLLVGRYLGRKGFDKVGIVVGIIPPLLGACIFIQQFFLTSSAQRSVGFLSTVGQLYPMVAVAPATKAMMTLGIREIDSRLALLLAYALMMGAFAIGFLGGRNKSGV